MKRNRSWLFISILTFITAMVWAALSINTALHQSTVSPDVTEILKPLDPKLDENVINQLQNRQRENP